MGNKNMPYENRQQSQQIFVRPPLENWFSFRNLDQTQKKPRHIQKYHFISPA